jgi:L-asparagine oxygenase
MSSPTKNEVQPMSQLMPPAASQAPRYDAAVDTEVLEVRLDARTSGALGEEMLGAVTASVYQDPDRAIRQAFRAFHRVASDELLANIERFILDPQAHSALRVSGLPIDPELPDTPADGQDTSAKKTFVTEGVLMGLGRTLGHPYAWRDEKKGMIVQQVCPVKRSEQKLSNEGSKATLALHVENSFSEHRPHYLILSCVRGDRDHHAKTGIASGRSIASRLSPEHLATARRPEFRIQAPDSFAPPGGGKAYSEPTPIFIGPDDALELRLDLPEFTECLTDAAQAAFDAIQEVAHQPGVVYDADMQPGEMLILANRKIAHSRTVFTPYYDGKDRWLQRMFVISDPWLMREHVDHRLRLI